MMTIVVIALARRLWRLAMAVISSCFCETWADVVLVQSRGRGIAQVWVVMG